MYLDRLFQHGHLSPECQQVHLTNSSRTHGRPTKYEKINDDSVTF